jgi:DNA-binding response OmpR family regulator
MRILLIEDNVALCGALQPILEKAGFSVDTSHDGTEGLYLLENGYYSACILDRMLPGLDGLTILRRAREKEVATPVLMLTALGRVGDRVDGLDAGADDYLTKPFDTRELIARLNAMLRRPGGIQQKRGISCGDIQLDPGEMTLTGPGASLTLSRRECDLLEILCRNVGKLQSRNALLSGVWGAGEFVEDANLDTYIHFVRRRLAAVGSKAKVTTVRGAGYKLEAGND